MGEAQTSVHSNEHVQLCQATEQFNKIVTTLTVHMTHTNCVHENLHGSISLWKSQSIPSEADPEQGLCMASEGRRQPGQTHRLSSPPYVNAVMP